MKVACVQLMARGVAEYEAAARDVLAMIDEAAKGGAELIVLPEAAYPAYFLAIDKEARDRALAGTAAFLGTVASRAKALGVHIAVGYVVRRGEEIFNAADLYDDGGKLVHSCDKSNMWHMDSLWTTPGERFAAFDTKLGRLGMLICADGRVPEITRILSLQGAKAIIDPVNLVASAPRPEELSNQQYAFLLPTRALENNVWFLVANKAGLEANTVGYLGRSMVIAPDGTVAAEASPDRPEIVCHDVNLDRAGNRPDERRPALYKPLTWETEDLPAYRLLTEPIPNPAGCEGYLATIQFEAASEEEYLEKASHYIASCEILSARLLCLPALLAGGSMDRVAGALRGKLPGGMLAVLPGTRGVVRQADVIAAGATLGRFTKTHGEHAGEAPSGGYEVLETPCGRLAVVFDHEMFLPEIARVYTLLGAELLVWADTAARPENLRLLRTRAAENKIYVARSSGVLSGESVAAASPDGAVLCAALLGTEQAASCAFFPPLARAKSVVPGTNIITGRFGRAYGELVKE